MRIETLKVDNPVHVTASDEHIELRIGDESPDRGRQIATLSVPQAEMVAHALGFQIARIRERQRCKAEERAHLAQVVHDTEFRLHEH